MNRFFYTRHLYDFLRHDIATTCVLKMLLNPNKLTTEMICFVLLRDPESAAVLSVLLVAEF